MSPQEKSCRAYSDALEARIKELNVKLIELRKDKERLDWWIENNHKYHISLQSFDGKWMISKQGILLFKELSSPREAIDKAMEATK